MSIQGELIKSLKTVEKEYILDVYHKCGRNKVHTARALGIGLRTLQRKLLRYERDVCQVSHD